MDLFRIDDAHPLRSGEMWPPHINTKSRIYFTENQKAAARAVDYTPISQTAYDAFHDFGAVANAAKYGGKALCAIGIALDVYHLGTTVYQDVTDEDGKIGKSTVAAASGTAGGWIGGAVGAKAGAMGGAALGTMILPGFGTLIGGFIGGVVGGLVGAGIGREAAEGTANWAYSL